MNIRAEINEFHIGNYFKKVAFEKGITARMFAKAIDSYHQNAEKIFLLDDMDIEDVIRISYLLQHNILFFVVNEYLSHLFNTHEDSEADSCLLTVNMKERSIFSHESVDNCDFLQKIHIGNCIREVVQKSHLSRQEVAHLLQCSESMISYLFRKKSLSVKKLLHISSALHYDFISNVYLSHVFISQSLHFLDDCIISVSRNKITVYHSKNKTNMLVFLRNSSKETEAKS